MRDAIDIFRLAGAGEKKKVLEFTTLVLNFHKLNTMVSKINSETYLGV
ncbi:MAG: hypothetical protein CLLPBCKN_001565 [Chroococcidiopsis cubana SAG 39.79]|nr:hypothetical protein [Chroococcidiopsis cubana SAG 39.79]